MHQPFKKANPYLNLVRWCIGQICAKGPFFPSPGCPAGLRSAQPLTSLPAPNRSQGFIGGLLRRPPLALCLGKCIVNRIELLRIESRPGRAVGKDASLFHAVPSHIAAFSSCTWSRPRT